MLGHIYSSAAGLALYNHCTKRLDLDLMYNLVVLSFFPYFLVLLGSYPNLCRISGISHNFAKLWYFNPRYSQLRDENL